MISVDSKSDPHVPDSKTGLVRELSRADGIALVVGTVIGSGIFLVPGPIAVQLHSLGAVLLVWTVGGLLSLFGALSLGELGSVYPGAGGLYVYLRHAFGRPLAFLYGWGLLSMIQTGSIATLAVGFSLYLSRLFPLSAAGQKVTAIACILLLTGVNCLGLRKGKLVQNVSTVSKLAGLALLFLLLVWRGHIHLLKSSFRPTTSLSHSLLPFGAALIAVLWAYEGWHVVSFTAGEFRSPRRDLPQSLFLGTAICAGIYLLLNIAYYSVLTPTEVRGTDHAAATAVQAAYGTGTTALISVLILTSILGAMNGMILTGPRVYYAMARDGIFFRRFGQTSRRFHTPILAIVAQGIWASLLTLTGSFQQLFTYVIFTAWIFYGLTVAAVIVLRIRKPDLERSFRVPAYPWVPLLFIIAAVGISASTILSDPVHACFGIAMILAGIPLYLFFRIVERPTATTGPERHPEAMK
ncbi:MAG TPA: amino acid permease [Acidobacteriaceae bacterium]|jgi:APA family basic amino acid/polyamine antiporter|nr:amino acid permease [Acidobacteriaceae bacterium]